MEQAVSRTENAGGRTKQLLGLAVRPDPVPVASSVPPMRSVEGLTWCRKLSNAVHVWMLKLDSDFCRKLSTHDHNSKSSGVTKLGR